MGRSSGSTSRWECIDFELEIREGGPLDYEVSARSPEGEAQEGMRFPFDKWELKDKLQALEIALLRSGRRGRRIRSPEEQAVQDFGQALFESLLVGDVRTHYEVNLREAKRQNKGLRLKLHIQPPKLARLPWEFLYDPGRNTYLCLSSKTPIVRYLELREPIEQLSVTPPLRILGMVASPRDLDPLNVEHEKRLMEEAVKDLQAQGRVELTWLEGQTRRHLQRAMWGGPWHIFHFVGHGGFDPNRDEGLVALANEEGYARFLPAEDLAQLLKDRYELRLVLLNSCEGAKGGEVDPFSGTAATLVRPGIPAVLAMQYEITDEAAIEFSRTFYEAVANGLPVDAAVAEARTSLKTEIGDTLEWGTPVLYMRSPDGRIFDVSAEVQHPEPIREQPAREEKAEKERRKRLDELYTQARRLHQDQEWQAVVDVFDQLHALDPAYPDPEGLLASAYEELAKPPTVKVPPLSGQHTSQARSTLENRGLKLGTRNEVSSNAIPEGEVIMQSPEVGTEVKVGSVVTVTVSSGPDKEATTTVPDVGPERQRPWWEEQWKRKKVLVAVAGAVAVFGSVAWIVAGLIRLFGPPDALQELRQATYYLGLVGVLGGLVGLHIRQAPSYGRLGTGGFLTAFIGTTLWLVARVATIFFDSIIFSTELQTLIDLVNLVGFMLLSVAILWARVLPRWCGVALIIGVLWLVAQILMYDLPEINLGAIYPAARILSGLAWLALGYVLWSGRGQSSPQQPAREM